MATIECRVKKIISEQLGRTEDEIKEESDLVNDLGADSLDIAELIMAFEDEFNIHIPDDKAKQLITVADTIKYITEVIPN